MTSGQRKLSFLGFAPQSEADEDEVKLDEEMDRVVWGGGGTEPGEQPGGISSTPTHSLTPPTDSPPSPPGHHHGSPRRTTEASRHVKWGAKGADSADQSGNIRELHGGPVRKLSLQEGLGGIGSGRRVSVTPHEASLPEDVTDDTQETQDGQPPGGHPPGGQNGLGGQNGQDGDTSNEPPDHRPHAVFVQLDELLGGGGGEAAEWRETARWIKYEEDVEEGAHRWGRPHVASLSFHSLLNLRRCLEAGAVELDVAARDLPGAASLVVAAMVKAGLLPASSQSAVLRALLLRHKHVPEPQTLRASISAAAGAARRRASHASLQSLWVEEPTAAAASDRGSLPTPWPGPGAPPGHGEPPGSGAPPGTCEPPGRRHSAHHLPRKANLVEAARRRSSHGVHGVHTVVSAERGEAGVPSAGVVVGVSSEELRRGAGHDSILRRIPGDAEATTVLVGAVPFLEQPTIAFVRLAHAIPMPTVTEVPVPVRFMFVLLGPPGADLDYHEVGRSISTLMSNPTFQEIAYRAEDRRELLTAINEFLDESIVLPPGNWERSELLPLAELRAKSEMIRRRKRDALQKKRASIAATPTLPAKISDEKKALLDGAEPPEFPDDPLAKTGKLFGGMIRDMRRRYPQYQSDIRDALSGQVAAAIVFMYFAALSSAITFGGLLAEKTDGQIGISETLVFTCLGGVLFSLVAGQPLMITGATGPLLLLDTALAEFCRGYGLHFLTARMYAGLWMLVIGFAVAAVEGSRAVKLVTRFTEDIFAFLISLIFISEPITNLVNVYKAHPLIDQYCAPNATDAGNSTIPIPDDHEPKPNTALFCTMLTLSTFIIAYYLRIFRNGKFLGRSARRALGDFGVPIAIVVMVLISRGVPVWTERLRVPEGLTPTAQRPWLVPAGPYLNTVPIWAATAMAAPALMVYIIVFMETHIAELIVAKPERRLRKGAGFHLDIVVLCVINAICGLFGAPWQCVATVRSVSHVAALTVMSTTHAPGDKPFVVQVKEQRVSGVLVAVLVGVSTLMSGALRLVPLAVLFGVFLYMGISALAGVQLWERTLLLFRPVKHHSSTPYVRRVPTLKMHLYTLIQLACLALLYLVKSSSFSLALPFFLVLMVPLRLLIGYLFTPMQLRALDGEGKDIERDDEPDFYEEAPIPG